MASGSGQAVLNTRSPANGTEANGASAAEAPPPQISTDLRQLVSILGQQGSGISLEQVQRRLKLLSTHRAARASQPSSHNHHHHHAPTTPSGPTSSSSSSHTPSAWAPSGGGGGGGTRKRGRGSVDSSSVGGEGDNPKRRRNAAYSSKQSGGGGSGGAGGMDKQQNKGLRHFSQRVCEKVRQKGTTTYNEVADELVKELSECEKRDSGNELIDHKNIRRRVYDALNVLMAMNIIAKEKKEIQWLGLPTNSAQECQHIEEELALTEERIRGKREEVENLLVQILSFKNLMRRNRERLSTSGAPAQNSAIALPFIIVNTNKKTTIDCSISSDKSEYVFNFDSAFELHNDVDVLKKMGLDCGLHSGCPSPDSLRSAKAMLPKAFEATLSDIVQSRAASFVTSTPVPQTPIPIPTPTTTTSTTLTPSPQHTPTPSSSTSTPSHSTNLSATLTPSTITSATAAAAAVVVVDSPLSTHSQVATPTTAARRIQQIQPSTPTGTLSGLNTTPARTGSPVASVVASSIIPSLPSTPGTPQSSLGLSSSRAVAAVMASAVHGVTSPATVGAITPHVHEQLASLSPVATKSPGGPKKIVTVKKLDTSEQINSILQQLQQNNHLLKQIPIVNAAASSNSSLSTLLSGTPPPPPPPPPAGSGVHGSPLVGPGESAATPPPPPPAPPQPSTSGRVLQPRPPTGAGQSLLPPQMLSSLFPNAAAPSSSS